MEKIQSKLEEIPLPSDSTVKKLIVLGAGTAIVGFGVIMTMSTGGLGYVIFPAITHAGAAVVQEPIKKLYTGEDLSMSDVGKKAAIGSAVGAVVGPIGYGGSELANASPELLKYTINLFTSSAASATGAAVLDASRALDGEEVTKSSQLNAIKHGMVIGAIGGTISDATNHFSGFFKRILARGAGAAATDAGIQFYQKGEVNLNETVVNAATQMVVGATAEASAVKARTNEKLLDREVKKGNLSREIAEEAKLTFKEINENPRDYNLKRIGDKRTHKLGGKFKDFHAFDGVNKENSTRILFEKIDKKAVFSGITHDHYKTFSKISLPDTSKWLNINLKNIRLREIKSEEEPNISKKLNEMMKETTEYYMQRFHYKNNKL